MFSRIFQKSLIGVMVLFASLAGLSVASKAEIRTLNLYFPHTKESLTVTYKKDGRYIPTAMKQLNWFFRDWRRNTATKMDPETIDLLWELYKDLGARKPAHIVSAYRSPATNGMLRRIGRKVARSSQHMHGRAIDVYFPDVSSATMRGSALARRVGGVGYYPRSGRYGFVHIDSGTVRHWPRMSTAKLASVIRRYRSTIGARHTNKYKSRTRIALAKRSSGGGPTNIVPKKFLSGSKLARAKTTRIPLPRARPLAVAMAAAAVDTYIVPVSAPGGKQNFGPQPTLGRSGIGTLLANNPLDTAPVHSTQRTNKAAKGSFVTALAAGRVRDVPLLRPMQASTSGSFWWSGDVNKMIRRDGAPQAFTLGNAKAVTPEKLSNEDKSALEIMIAALTGKSKAVVPHKAVSRSGVVRSGKSDSLRVNRAAKSDLLATRPGQVSRLNRLRSSDKLAGNFEAVLKAADKPLNFIE